MKMVNENMNGNKTLLGKLEVFKNEQTLEEISTSCTGCGNTACGTLGCTGCSDRRSLSPSHYFSRIGCDYNYGCSDSAKNPEAQVTQKYDIALSEVI